MTDAQLPVMNERFNISPVTEEDIPALGDLLLRTKLRLTINRLLWKDWPNEAAQRSQYTAAIEGAFKDANIEDVKVIDSDTQAIVAYLGLARRQPVDHPSQERSDAQTKHPEELDKDVCDMVFKAVDDIGRDWKDKEHLELVFVVVDTSYRKRGIGSALMDRCFNRATTASLPLVVYSEPAAHDFFVKLGLQDTTHADMDLARFAPHHSGFGLFRLTGMVWKADHTAVEVR